MGSVVRALSIRNRFSSVRNPGSFDSLPAAARGFGSYIRMHLCIHAFMHHADADAQFAQTPYDMNMIDLMFCM